MPFELFSITFIVSISLRQTSLRRSRPFETCFKSQNSKWSRFKRSAATQARDKRNWKDFQKTNWKQLTSLCEKTFSCVFCVVSSNELVILDSLENSKQYKKRRKTFPCVRGLIKRSTVYNRVSSRDVSHLTYCGIYGHDNWLWLWLNKL